MTRSIHRESLIRASHRQVSSEFPDKQLALLDVFNGTYYGLNPTAARIWKMIQTPCTVGTIVDSLLERYDVEEERCMEDVSSCLDELAARNLVEITSALA